VFDRLVGADPHAGAVFDVALSLGDRFEQEDVCQ
jgi:hypothetical protein